MRQVVGRPLLTSINGLAFTGEGKLVRKATGYEQNTDLYGTTSGGGTIGGTICPLAAGCGTIFKITLSGTLTTLHSFCPSAGCADGAGPAATLVQATNGYLYGTTARGGSDNSGTVFEITPSGGLKTLYSFCSQGQCADGFEPSGLIQASDGNLYGTNELGGIGTIDCPAGCGTIFKLTPKGSLTTLYDFCSESGCVDGFSPSTSAGLVQGTNGTLYGTAFFGGSYGNYGGVVSLSTGLRPFVKAQPASGKTGATIEILGTNLTGATSVTFNGTPSPFRVVASSLIVTTVPSGVTTGTVQVVTPPRGTLSSFPPFRVLP